MDSICHPLTLPLERELSELAAELPDESSVHLGAGDEQGTTAPSTVAPVDQAAADMDAAALMLDRAINNGLAVEIVMAFGVMRWGGDDTQTSAAAALNEWDI